MDTRTVVLRARMARAAALIIISIAWPNAAQARNYLFQNITDLPGGPGAGRSAVINDTGDIAFVNGNQVWFYDRSAGSFLDVTSLPGAPANPFFVKLNNNGDIAIIETSASTGDLWLFEQAMQTFTNVSGLPGYPGNSQSNFTATAFDINDNGQISFHSGDNNFGSVYVYDHASGSFDWINGKPGAATFGRENEINNLGQVLYMGFPSTYLYDPAINTTTNINTLPGGPGPALTNLDLNDNGDVALISTSVAVLYDASSGMFLNLAAVPGFPAATASSRSDLGNGSDITFWLDRLYAFDAGALRFSQLTDFPGGPQLGQTESSIDSSGRIVITAGTDVWLGTPRPYGDYDNNGDVDGGDLAMWETTYGSAVAIGTAADGNSDREVSGLDFLIWQQNAGPGPLTDIALTVPEPALAGLLVMVAISGLGRRQRSLAEASH